MKLLWRTANFYIIFIVPQNKWNYIPAIIFLLLNIIISDISFCMEVSNMLTFILGMMLGGFLGVTYLALCIVGSRGERDYIE